jgi:hypothetical protein
VILTVAGTRTASDRNPGVHNNAGPTIAASACELRHAASGLPPLVQTDVAPGSQLGSILSIARQPAADGGLAQVGPFDRDPVEVVAVFRRYIRIVNGERGTRLAFFPAIVCNRTESGPSFSPSATVRVNPEEAMVMVVLSNPPPRTAILVGTAATIRSGAALPGLDLPNSRGWIQATVVPDGVARVVMHFTPPFLHHYTAAAAIHNNIGIIVRKPDYTPTTVSWYAANGHLIHTFVDHKDLRYEQCLAKHHTNCTD